MPRFSDFITASGAKGTEVAVPCEVPAISITRRQLADELVAAGCSEQVVRNAVVVLSELLMNAMIHGVPDEEDRVCARWWVIDGVVAVSVTDAGGTGLPRLERASLSDAGGRGLLVVDAVSASWTVDTSDGTTVTAIVRD
ncbi:ATP-binding protein [Nocardioides sp. R-C-SC26]|uniref:ATP-binding protein n=1 Tax=Nocardioides sp. R-C-SC26 TaxID=2870414 RepID=UPI001E370736|nr:ATP-binding protein [Nocardioides sp. R-C-SC26]